jgi:hypothetical protein
MTNKIYIGNTQQNFKKRIMGHFQDIKKLMERKKFTPTSTLDISLVFGQEEQHHHHRGCSEIS